MYERPEGALVVSGLSKDASVSLVVSRALLDKVFVC
jgi:hypothetical protein